MSTHLPLIQIDAFADEPFTGNPAAVMPLESWLPAGMMQQLAEENNLSETAFFVPDLPPSVDPPEAGEPAYALRWFTPSIEVTLCGHATLATAAYVFEDLDPQARRVWFHTLSGWLSVSRSDDRPLALIMDFPADRLEPVDVNATVAAALAVEVKQAYQSMDLVCVVATPEEVAGLDPDHTALRRLPQRGVIVTALNDDRDRFRGADFVSRWFGARAGVGEDPVTGSAHTQIAPMWAHRLSKATLRGRQLSRRGGTVDCEVRGDRVLLSGGYRRFLTGTVHL